MTDWKTVKLGDVLKLSNGKSSPVRNDDERYPVYGANGIIGKAERFNANPSTIIIGRVGSYCGNLYYLSEECWVTDNAIKGESNEGYDPEFLFYLLKTLHLENRKVGSGQPLLNQTIIGSIEVNVPDFEEQKRIAHILSTFDKKIELLQKQNKTLEAIAQTLYKRLFVDFEFPNAIGAPYKSSGGKMVPSELGEIPEVWEVGKLGDEFEIIMGQSPPGSSYNENRDGMIFFQGRAEFNERFPKIRLYTRDPKRIAEKFDVLVSVRAPVGDINVAFSRCCIGRGLGAVRGKFKSYTLYKIQSLKEAFEKFESQGTVFGSMNKDNFSNIEVCLPNEKIRKEFESICYPIDQKFFINHQQIQTLHSLLYKTLPKLITK